jgi:hypothetical protein
LNSISKKYFKICAFCKSPYYHKGHTIECVGRGDIFKSFYKYIDWDVWCVVGNYSEKLVHGPLKWNSSSAIKIYYYGDTDEIKKEEDTLLLIKLIKGHPGVFEYTWETKTDGKLFYIGGSRITIQYTSGRTDLFSLCFVIKNGDYKFFTKQRKDEEKQPVITLE